MVVVVLLDQNIFNSLIKNMKLIDAIAYSLKNLWKRKLRTVLTMSAVVIGGFLITIVFSLVAGLEKFFELQFNTFSDERFIEMQAEKYDMASMLSMAGLSGEKPAEVEDSDSSSLSSLTSFMPKSFKDEDFEKIRAVDHVKTASDLLYSMNTKWINMESQEKNYQVTLYSYPRFAQEKLTLVAGEYLNDDEFGKIILANQYSDVFGLTPDEMIGKKVYIKVAQELSMTGEGCIVDPTSGKLGDKVYEFTVVGVTEKTILSSLGLISLEQAKDIEKYSRCSENVLNDEDSERIVAWVEVDNVENVSQVEKDLEDLGYDARTYAEEKNQMGQLFDVLKYFFSTFGVLAMVVASLGIVNTLFMAIYERTREIGIMKAVGASSINILFMFTVEAAIIGLIGGCTGVAFGLGVSYVADVFLHDGVGFLPDSVAFLKPYESLSIAVISFDMISVPILSTVVAIVAGLIPAFRASKLDPVDALRYE